MKKLSIAFLMIAGLLGMRSQAQVKDASQRLRDQALKMGQALAAGDYKTFTSYSHPYVLKLVGGPEKMEAALKQVAAGMKQQGMRFMAIKVGQPSALVKSRNEWQATVVQQTQLSTPNGAAMSSSVLLAFSSDNGLSWKFLDTHNKDIATLRKALPNLSPRIEIPATPSQGNF